jgi:tripartite ATP-independent transporter DctP family solute receptor
MITFGRRAVLSVAAAVLACFLVTPVIAQTSLRFAHHHAVGGQVDQTAQKFAEIVNTKSNGSIQIKVFPAAQLGQEREAFGLVNTGVLDLSITSLGILDQVYPVINVTSLPFVFRDWEHVYKLYNGEFGQALRDGIKQRTGTQLLGYVHLGFRDMLFRGAPLADVTALKGVKMRSAEAAMWFRMFELLGARPTPVTWGEVYSAMQTGVAEGLDSPASAALDNKFNEVTKSLVRTRHMFGSMGIFASSLRLSRLPKEQQEILFAAAQEATDWSNKTIGEPSEAQAYKKMVDLGMQVVDPIDRDAWAKAMQPMWAELTTKTPGSDRLLKIILETK